MGRSAVGDDEFFERNITDDALLIFPGSGNTYTKASGIAAMVGHPAYVKYDVAEPRIIHIGESAAVLTHHANKGEWRLALHQWTPTDEREV